MNLVMSVSPAHLPLQNLYVYLEFDRDSSLVEITNTKHRHLAEDLRTFATSLDPGLTMVTDDNNR